MELVPAGVSLSFEVTFDSDSLSVGMTVYDTTGGSPVQVLAPTLMSSIYRNTYSGKFSPSSEHTYVIIKSVYTDNTLTVLDDDYASGSESIIAENLGPFGQLDSGCLVVGIVDSNETIVGIVEC